MKKLIETRIDYEPSFNISIGEVCYERVVVEIYSDGTEKEIERIYWGII